MKRVVLYGTEPCYNRNLNQIRLLEEIQDIRVEGVCLPELSFSSQLDGFHRIRKEDIASIPCDYVLVLADFDEKQTVLKLAESDGVPRPIIVPFRVLQVPYMTMETYDRIREKRWSVICNNCFGGILFEKLGLKYNTPFIKMAINGWDVIRLAENISYYMAAAPVFDHWENATNANEKPRFPVLRLGDVLLKCSHHTDPETALEDYMRRADRLDPSRLIIIISTVSAKLEHSFQERPLPGRKLCFSSAEEHDPRTIYLPAKDHLQLLDMTNRLASNTVGPISLVKFLLGEEDFSR